MSSKELIVNTLIEQLSVVNRALLLSFKNNGPQTTIMYLEGKIKGLQFGLSLITKMEE